MSFSSRRSIPVQFRKPAPRQPVTGTDNVTGRFPGTVTGYRNRPVTLPARLRAGYVQSYL